MAFRRRTKSYPLFSQEFVIHNHADIGFCLVLCVLIGLMFEVSETGEGVPFLVRRPANPCRSQRSLSELERGAAMYVIRTPGFVHCTPLGLLVSPNTTSPQPPAPRCASRALLRGPLGTHSILQLPLQP